MSIREKLHIGLSLSPTWLRGEAWRRPDSRVEEMFESAFYAELAQKAEAAHLDFVFRADSLFVDPEGLATAPGFSAPDPTVLLASIAAATSRIGLVTTASTTFNAPYAVARQIQSLNWTSKGRAGWNIVTALDGERNFGLSSMPDAEWRYERAREFTSIVLDLWSGYPADALLLDREAGRFADTARVRRTDHRGPHFSVEGPLTLPAHPTGRIPLFQAGASSSGRDFAASTADAIFAATPDRGAAIALRADLRERAVRFGRPADAIRVMPGLALVLASTLEEARDIHAEFQKPRDRERAYAFAETALGTDIRTLPHDRPVPLELVGPIAPDARSRTHAELLRRIVLEERPAICDLLRRPEITGSAHWQIVGTPDMAVDEIRAWQKAGALDGLIALPGQTLRSLDLFLDEVVPRLAEKGAFRAAYDSDTLAGHLGIV